MKTTLAHLACLSVLTFMVIEVLPFISNAQVNPSTQASPSALTRKQWEEDLDTLAANVPRVHGYAFHVVPEQDFQAAVRSLRTQLGTMNEDQILTGFVRLIGMI
jgi:hypothetical protein